MKRYKIWRYKIQDRYLISWRGLGFGMHKCIPYLAGAYFKFRFVGVFEIGLPFGQWHPLDAGETDCHVAGAPRNDILLVTGSG